MCFYKKRKKFIMNLQQPPTTEIVSKQNLQQAPSTNPTQNSDDFKEFLKNSQQLLQTLTQSYDNRMKVRQQGNEELNEILDNTLLKHREEILEYYREIKKYGEELKQILTKSIQKQQEFSTLNVRLSYLEDQQTNARCNSLQQSLSNLNTRLSQLENQYTSLKYFTLTLLIMLGAGALVFPTKITALFNHLIYQNTTS